MPAALSAAFFRHLDESRRRHAAWADLAGLAPVETPSEACLTGHGMRLRHYPAPESTGPALLLVPAPIKRHHIWDFPPPRSVVAHALARGCKTHLLEWLPAAPDWSIDHAVAAIDRAVDHIRERTGQAPHLVGHSLGGTLSALYAARHPAQPASLTVIESPLNFGRSTGAFAPLLERAPAGASLGDDFGCIPGTLLNLASVLASPKEFMWDRQRDAISATLQGGDALQTHLRAMRWSLDEFPMPGKLFSQVVDHLYREDRFMQGTLIVQDRPVSPRDVAVPLAAVVDPTSRILPADSVTGFLDAVPVADKLLLHYQGDIGVALRHVGALIGTSAHRELWPRIFSWQAGVDDLRPTPARATPPARRAGRRQEKQRLAAAAP